MFIADRKQIKTFEKNGTPIYVRFIYHLQNCEISISNVKRDNECQYLKRMKLDR